MRHKRRRKTALLISVVIIESKARRPLKRERRACFRIFILDFFFFRFGIDEMPLFVHNKCEVEFFVIDSIA